ncbi:flagellar basal body protein [Donghicola mangrovi]|uniref:Flagellar biosynthesis protein FlgB n=1 Tax=Donghicola mangrovi TaxID=2729614 RepID=A0A850PYV3_9RHOB|nr:flagellar basal body protein [Donghicola mangrovi]NVO22447.1 flagellar biosynthesis protein FlgB [Donghicola mangrovi]
MFENIGIFRVASGMISHATAQQKVTALNISNAETPGYTAKTLKNFDISDRAPREMAMRSSRQGHLSSFTTLPSQGARTLDTKAPVDLESELLTSAQIEGDHQRAVGIYRSTLGILRSSLGKM